MAKPLGDAELVDILYRATGLIGPVLDALEHDDPFTGNERLHSDGDDSVGTDADPSFSDKAISAAADSLSWVTNKASAPGSAKWQGLSVDERSDWWVSRVGALTSVLVAYPGVFGAASDRLPIQDVLGFTQQAFVLCAIARVHGVTDRARQTDLLASVLCGRTVDAAAIRTKASEKAVSESADPPAPSARSWSARDVVARVWTTAKLLRAVVGEAKRRPAPGRLSKLLSAVPVVGAAADYVGERSALKRAAKAATAWLAKGPVQV
ncbi:hypothetical protein [Williamsia phyllosphaerae]|uniref:EcsC protein family protein n=1 Tax=Williamsia phyllosphaerae TaxID=885042 RepID=A0ABQ1UTL4_9NOCA|nr:hypothetical protein [Williamsia phyllosphaerae]GGF25888.1 hypothetical protein GCM10007298_22180 [Williamsia phyllosphaerae]